MFSVISTSSSCARVALELWQCRFRLITQKSQRDMEIAITGFIAVQVKLEAGQGTPCGIIRPQSIKKSKMLGCCVVHVGYKHVMMAYSLRSRPKFPAPDAWYGMVGTA